MIAEHKHDSSFPTLDEIATAVVDCGLLFVPPTQGMLAAGYIDPNIPQDLMEFFVAENENRRRHGQASVTFKGGFYRQVNQYSMHRFGLLTTATAPGISLILVQVNRSQ